MKMRETAAVLDACGYPVIITTLRARPSGMERSVLDRLARAGSVRRDLLRRELGWGNRRFAAVLGRLWRLGMIESPYDSYGVVRLTEAGRAVSGLWKGEGVQ